MAYILKAMTGLGLIIIFTERYVFVHDARRGNGHVFLTVFSVVHLLVAW